MVVSWLLDNTFFRLPLLQKHFLGMFHIFKKFQGLSQHLIFCLSFINLDETWPSKLEARNRKGTDSNILQHQWRCAPSTIPTTMELECISFFAQAPSWCLATVTRHDLNHWIFNRLPPVQDSKVPCELWTLWVSAELAPSCIICVAFQIPNVLDDCMGGGGGGGILLPWITVYSVSIYAMSHILWKI